MLASFSPLSTDLCSCHWQVVELGRIVISMTPTLKRILLAAFSLLALLVTAAGLYLWREVKRPKRVWVAYSEKERVREGETEELPSGETAIFAQQRISWRNCDFRATADQLADVQQHVLPSIDQQQVKGGLSRKYFCHSVPRRQSLR